MIFFKNKGLIQKKLTYIIVLVTFFTSFLAYSSFAYWYLSNEESKHIELSNTLSETLSQDFAQLILLNKISTAADITSKLRSFKKLDKMVLYTLDKKPIFQYSVKNKSFSVSSLKGEFKEHSYVLDKKLIVYLDASYQGSKLGYIQMVYNIETLEDLLKRDALMLLIVSFLLFNFSYFLAYIVAKKFSEPILYLVKFLERIEYFDSLKERVKIKDKNEFGKLYSEINTMLERIENSHRDSKVAAIAFETQNGMTITDANKKILQVNKSFTAITGYTAEEVIGKTPSILKSGIQSKAFYKDMLDSLDRNNSWRGEVYNRHKNGSIYPEQLTIQTVLDNKGKVIYYVGSFTDLTLQKESEAKIDYLEQYDGLTGLANKELLLRSIQEDIETQKPYSYGSLICFDIKDFKMINDAYSHKSGDKLLQEIASRVKNNFKESSKIARIGADEFAIWFKDIAINQQKASFIAQTNAQYLVNILSQEFKLYSKSVNISTYVGISLYNHSVEDSNIVLKQADGALHLAKDNKHQNITFFDEKIESLALTHLFMHSALNSAIENGEFELYYQTQCNERCETYGAEALIRWNHPLQGLISPVEFIPIAEKTGLILPIGLWVLKESCRQLKLFSHDVKTQHLTISVNISAVQFNQEIFVDQVKEVCQEYKVDTSKLKFELTESILVDDMKKTMQKMDEIKELGIKISLDDFGTGYSSLQYLKNLPLDQVKIDQSFVKNMLDNDKDIAIIKSILLIGDAFNFEIIAEGVETKEHYEFLKELGCKCFQGYYFAKPQSVENIKI